MHSSDMSQTSHGAIYRRDTRLATRCPLIRHSIMAPPPTDQILRDLCSKPETLEKARSIMRRAKAKTGPGSGYEMGHAAIGLSAICAYLASLELDNGDVNETMAQITSCLAPRTFAQCLNTVRTALASSSSDTRSKVKYEDLIAIHKVLKGDLVAGWMDEAEETLLKSGEVRVKTRADETLVKCAVFYWTVQLLSLARIKPDHLTKPYSIEPDDFHDVVEVLNDVCLVVSDRIRVEVDRLKASARQVKTKQAAVPAATPSQMLATSKLLAKAATPSKPSLKRSLPTPSITEPESVSPSKRRVAFVPKADGGDALPQTPAKRRRVAMASAPISSVSEASTRAPSSSVPADDEVATPTVVPLPVASTSSVATPRRGTRRSVNEPEAPASQVLEEQQEPSDDENEEDREDEGLSRSKHFRTPFIDRGQWFSRDPKIERECKMAETYKQKMVAVHGHPLARLRPAFDWKTATPAAISS
ncbi:hypothetical protein OE88DRAFT_1387065 [Heliocybe sulcata]|uniref:Origin recognition complex subunit 6 n=1 Tax=Heliocybe sulcata TaxID=5364 RepID=A0A5C3N771_9AGAM|nr:hypothetical protein OE88DRAFT_1387065 [Heliocybe sulcata]